MHGVPPQHYNNHSTAVAMGDCMLYHAGVANDHDHATQSRIYMHYICTNAEAHLEHVHCLILSFTC